MLLKQLCAPPRFVDANRTCVGGGAETLANATLQASLDAKELDMKACQTTLDNLGCPRSSIDKLEREVTAVRLSLRRATARTEAAEVRHGATVAEISNLTKSVAVLKGTNVSRHARRRTLGSGHAD